MHSAAVARGVDRFASKGRPDVRNETRFKPARLGWQIEAGVRPYAGESVFFRVAGKPSASYIKRGLPHDAGEKTDLK
jgi:hypothetical protein